MRDKHAVLDKVKSIPRKENGNQLILIPSKQLLIGLPRWVLKTVASPQIQV